MRSFLAAAVLFAAAAGAQAQGNVSLSPAPVPYPYFMPGRFDAKVGGMFGSMASEGFDMTMGGGYGYFRKAANETLAFDMGAALFGLSGTLEQGSPPSSTPLACNTSRTICVPYFARSNGEATMTGFLGSFSANLEIQAAKDPRRGSLLLFAGPQMQFFTIDTLSPYSLIVPPPFGNAGQAYSGYTNTSSFQAFMAGIQIGVQGGIRLGDFRLAPFFMLTTQSGSATITEDPGVSGASSTSVTADIDAFTSTSFGVDAIYIPWGLSVGSMIQQAAASGSSDNGVKTSIIQLSWHFGGFDKEALGSGAAPAEIQAGPQEQRR